MNIGQNREGSDQHTPGTLYLVSTPIGNLGDITYRAAEILRSVDFIAAEDTRVTLKLLNHLGIKKQLVSYYEHNSNYSGETIISRLLAGESCALVTDAGTPAVSDPGEDIVRLCAESGVDTVPVPGACAAIAALSVSALPTQRFCFEGFLSKSTKRRFEHLRSLKDERRTLIFYEAPHKLLRTLHDMLEVFGDRDISISRELTKIYEETMRTTLSKAIAYFSETPPRGELVIVMRGSVEPEERMDISVAVDAVKLYRSGGMPLKEAARRVADETGYSKNELYELAVRE